MANTRQARIDEEVKRALSEILANDVKDDRLGALTSITKAQVTNDLKFARIHISVLGSEKERQRTMDALRHAGGFIRSRLARKTSLRRAPELIFEEDNSVEHGLHIARLIEEVNADMPAEGAKEAALSAEGVSDERL